MDYQWTRIESVAKAERDLYRNDKGKKVKVGSISVDSVLREAGRDKGFISHIENPMDPIILYDAGDKGIDSVRERIDKWYLETKDARGHKVRYDGLGLLSGVVSWPPQDDNEDNEAYKKRLEEFESDLLYDLIKEYGDDLVLVLRHDDEPFHGMNAGKTHYHWHFFCVKRPGKKFDLHPGFLARSEHNVSRKNREDMTNEELRAIYEEGRRAYKKAMIAFQDNFYERLGRKHGLNRIGPRRLRRSRSEQVELETFIEKELAYAKKMKDEALDIKAKADALLAEANIVKAEVEKEKLAAQKEVERIIAEGKSEAKKLIETAKKEADKITKDAKSEAKEIKDNAWLGANKITEAAKKQAVSLIDRAKGFIDTLLDKVLELQGGDSLVQWARTFLNSVTGQNTRSAGKRVVVKKEPHNRV